MYIHKIKIWLTNLIETHNLEFALIFTSQNLISPYFSGGGPDNSRGGPDPPDPPARSAHVQGIKTMLSSHFRPKKNNILF